MCVYADVAGDDRSFLHTNTHTYARRDLRCVRDSSGVAPWRSRLSCVHRRSTARRARSSNSIAMLLLNARARDTDDFSPLLPRPLLRLLYVPVQNDLMHHLQLCFLIITSNNFCLSKQYPADINDM